MIDVTTYYADVNDPDDSGHDEPYFQYVVKASDYEALRAENERLREDAMKERNAIKLLVGGGFVSEDKANEALNIAHGFIPRAALKAVPEGWSARPVTDGDEIGFIIGAPAVNGVRTSTSVWTSDDDPAHRLLAVLLAALRQPVADEREAFVAWATRLYNTGYHAGHHDTVEGGYTHVYRQDMDSYHEEVVAEWLTDNPQQGEDALAAHKAGGEANE